MNRLFKDEFAFVVVVRVECLVVHSILMVVTVAVTVCLLNRNMVSVRLVVVIVAGLILAVLACVLSVSIIAFVVSLVVGMRVWMVESVVDGVFVVVKRLNVVLVIVLMI